MMRFNGLNFLLAQQAPAAPDAKTVMQPDQTGGAIKSMLLMVVFVIGMWFLLIAPQRRKTKELAATLKSLKAGDKIVTNSGILGVVLSIKDKTLSIRSADTKLEILKSSVLEVIERGGESSESKS
jgi:preprotein translocase subunit YajC